MRTLTACGTGALALLAAVGSPAQEKEPPKDNLIYRKEVVEIGPGQGPMLQDQAMAFVWAREGFDGAVVKNAPYAADAVTETVQTLGDGNRIVRRTSAQVARDRDGRTRREHALAAVGPLLAAGDEPRTVFINDPVAGVHYVLDPEEKVARRISVPAGKGPGFPGPATREIEVAHAGAIRVEGPPPEGGPREDIRIIAHPPFPRGKVFERRLPTPTEESLGRQTIEGVEAEGTRTTFTIAAGEIGNERPIEVVSERWYSPELQVVVMSRHNDPRFGETTYRLTNLTRADPDRALFEIPADFKLEAAPPKVIQMRRKPEGGKP
jgi:hypothetical protein